MIRDIKYITKNNEDLIGNLELFEIDDVIILKFNGKNISEIVQGENYFDALCNLRIKLEEKNIRIVCNGSSLNVYPSGMALNMGSGQMAYMLKNGRHSSSKELVNIFDLDMSIYQKSTVKEQKEFFEQWNTSERKRIFSKPLYSVETIKSEKEFLFFWGHQPSKDGTITKSCLSQWWPCKFEKDEIVYSSSEQWMMAEKARVFLDKERLQLILNTHDPKEAKKYGRLVSNFNEDVWKLKRYSIVKEGNFLKFNQNAELKDYLLSTGNSIIVEASPYDRIWGIGMKNDDQGIKDPKNWKGKNLLGFALMEVRDTLKEINYSA